MRVPLWPGVRLSVWEKQNPDALKVVTPFASPYEPIRRVLSKRGWMLLLVRYDWRDRRNQLERLDTPENGAWHTVWLEGKWRWVTSRMTTPQREYAADRVAAYDRYLAHCDGEMGRAELEGLRWRGCVGGGAPGERGGPGAVGVGGQGAEEGQEGRTASHHSLDGAQPGGPSCGCLGGPCSPRCGR